MLLHCLPSYPSSLPSPKLTHPPPDAFDPVPPCLQGQNNYHVADVAFQRDGRVSGARPRGAHEVGGRRDGDQGTGAQGQLRRGLARCVPPIVRRPKRLVLYFYHFRDLSTCTDL